MKSTMKMLSSIIDKYSNILNKRQSYQKVFKWFVDFFAGNFTILVSVVLISLLIYLLYNKNRYSEGFTNEKPPFSIDIVYTWAGEKKDSTDKRQADHNELKYSLRSVNMHMPWVNHIYIFMNSPKKMPSWMRENKKIPVFLTGHVTKEGSVAGPSVLEDMVDVVLHFEGNSDNGYRIISGIKNRFGSTNEIGIFEMMESGIRQVDNPSSFFIHDYNSDCIWKIMG